MMPVLNLAQWTRAFIGALAVENVEAVADLFGDQCFWRDILAFTWDIRTFEGRDAIAKMLSERQVIVRPSGWHVEKGQAANATEGFIGFATAAGRCRGYVRLVDGRCLTMFTTLEELAGFSPRQGRSRPEKLNVDGEPTWTEKRQATQAEIGVSRQPYVLIVGGGQCGLGLAAQLGQMDVPTLIVDKHPRPGDQWRSRYKSLSLHDPVWYDHMPFLPFPEHWPVYCPKDKIGDWLEAYASIMELNFWGESECVAGSYDEATRLWTVTIRRAGELIELRPAHVVVATGNSGFPHIPAFRGADEFSGSQFHSSQYTDGARHSGKKVVVIGANNSAHDICADLSDHGANVTMIQRSPTHVLKTDTLLDVYFNRLYSEDALAAGITTEKADYISSSMPIRLIENVQKDVQSRIAERDAIFYAELEEAGFMHWFGDDGSGLLPLVWRREGGYYFDVGASRKIIDGTIGLRSRVEVDHIGVDGVTLSDGSFLDADVIIYATGFNSLETWVASILSPEIASNIGKIWGYGSGYRGDRGPWLGELRNMWKPTNQQGLWIHAGNLQRSRFYSRYLALQIKARQLGVPTEVYR